MSLKVKKPTFEHMGAAKIQISLCMTRILTGRILDSQGRKVSSFGQQRLCSDCVDAQADLSLRWAHMSEDTLHHAAFHGVGIFRYQPIHTFIIAAMFITKRNLLRMSMKGVSFRIAPIIAGGFLVLWDASGTDLLVCCLE